MLKFIALAIALTALTATAAPTVAEAKKVNCNAVCAKRCAGKTGSQIGLCQSRCRESCRYRNQSR